MTLIHRLSGLTRNSVLTENESLEILRKLRSLADCEVYADSITPGDRGVYFVFKKGAKKNLGILGAQDAAAAFHGATGPAVIEGETTTLTACPMDASNAARLRDLFPFLVPRPFGIEKSFGCGDRLGQATPGHIRAIRKTCGLKSPTSMKLNLAQQSMRENARTGRTPESVIDDATWGVFQEGWKAGYGADADHLKTAADIDRCVDAGYTFFTIDPGAYVDESADLLSVEELRSRYDARLPWMPPDSEITDLTRRLTSTPIDLGDRKVVLTQEQVVRAGVKYGEVVKHTVLMYRHLQERMAGRPFDLEMSVDETNSVTTPAEHIYIASELRRQGVKWVSLAPRYPGRFEKGVDYLGPAGQTIEATLQAFEKSFAEHVSVARAFGPYKLSLHSGSDKFAIYPVYARLAGELVHVKTAGTSYLEALRALAHLNPALFREVVRFAVDRYPADRATYHVSADVSNIPDTGRMSDDRLPFLLEDFHARQALHVTFGSVLNDARLRAGLYQALDDGENLYYDLLERHFEKHLRPFC